MRRGWVCLVAALLCPACGQSSPMVSAPTSPTSVTVTTPAPTPTSRYTLSGIVRAAGAPAAGATVALLTFESGDLIVSTATDGNGAYRLPEVQNVSPFSGALVSVSRPEYFTETKYIPMNQDQKFDFELERAETISAGEVIHSAVGVAARCASLGYGGGGGSICRRFVLTVPAAGTLEITVSSTPASPFDGTVLKPDGSIGAYAATSLSPLRLAHQVTAGRTYQIDVVHISPATRDFVLNTTMR